MKLNPLDDHIVVRPRTPGGIELPESAREKQVFGKVVGPGCMLDSGPAGAAIPVLYGRAVWLKRQADDQLGPNVKK